MVVVLLLLQVAGGVGSGLLGGDDVARGGSCFRRVYWCILGLERHFHLLCGTLFRRLIPIVIICSLAYPWIMSISIPGVLRRSFPLPTSSCSLGSIVSDVRTAGGGLVSSSSCCGGLDVAFGT